MFDITKYQQQSPNYETGMSIVYKTHLQIFILSIPYNKELDVQYPNRVKEIIEGLETRLLNFPIIIKSKTGVFQITQKDFISLETKFYRT